jgi:5-methylcytosine-specific restriction enzyme subunit McrC
VKPKLNIQVFEHQSLRIGDQDFTKDHWESLIKLNELHEGKYFSVIHRGIKFSEYVGVIQVNDATIEILPKVDKGSDDKEKWKGFLISMMKACKKLSPKSHGTANVSKQNLSLLELYFDMYLNEVNQLTRQGLIKQYRKESKNVKALKGKLEFSNHIKENLIHKERFYTNHQVYDKDHQIHQILSKAIGVIKLMSKGSFVHDKCLRTKLSFPEVKDIAVNYAIFDRITLNRKTQHYEKALEIARLILLNYSPDIRGGKEKMLALLFDMNTLWEEYVLRMLQIASKNESGMIITGQARKKFWEGRYVKPDIVIEYKGVTTVIDTKWKRVFNNRASIEDLRQMYVYNKYWGAQKSMLLYPKDDLSKQNITGSYYQEDSQIKDEENQCEIGYLNIVKENQLNSDWAKEFLNEHILNRDKI